MEWPWSKKEEHFEVLDPSSGTVEDKKRAKMKTKEETWPTSELEVSRKDPILLENMFINEPIIFAGGTIWQALTEECDFQVLVNDEKTQSIIDDLIHYSEFKNEFLGKVPFHFYIWGRAWIEYLKTKGEVVEFLATDPKYMKFKPIKVGYPAPLLNNLGRPKEYMQEMMDGSKIYFQPHTEMAYLPHIEITHTQLGIGFIEPLYNDVTLKENLEQARVQTAYNMAYPKPVVGYGSQAFRADSDMKQRAESLAQELADPEVDWVTYPKAEFDVSFPAMKDLNAEMINQLIYTTKLQAAVLRIPFAVLIQSGADEGRATLETLVDFFEYNFKGFQRRMKPHEVIRDVLYLNYNSDPSTKIDLTGLRTEYGVLSHKSAKEMIMRIMRMGKVDLLNKDDPEVQQLIKSALGLKSLKTIQKQANQMMDAMDQEE